MDLKKIYELRQNFTVIGLTGRTGAGCTKIAKLLSSSSVDRLSVRKPMEFRGHSDFSRKYIICYNFSKVNWKPYKIINYKSVLLLYLLRENRRQMFDEIALWFPHLESFRGELSKVLDSHERTVKSIEQMDSIGADLRDEEDLKRLGDTFFSKDFLELSNSFYGILDKTGIPGRIIFTHRIANNLRAFGKPLSKSKDKEENYAGSSIHYIYTVAETINRLIKGLKGISSDDVHIAIDCLRNSLEIMFFKERYSGFYMLALNSKKRAENIRESLMERYKDQSEEASKKIEDLDNLEYKCNDFKKGEFFSPDVQNCIQKSDVHLNSDTLDDAESVNTFKNLDEYLIKFTSLIQQPGIVTPSAQERCMQVAYNAKYNSGCISRQVGAVITDDKFTVKSIGWNDVPAGAVPCLQRNVADLIKPTGPIDTNAYSTFEKDDSKNIDDRLNYREELKLEYEEKLLKADLKGKNCPFCFKTTYNSFEGNDNQVHTRSLHAEENAMLQISKKGGVALQGGYLFTTASPCELCSKKAYQLGIKQVYFIDPYPGIAENQILRMGERENQPSVILFSGAVGRAYHKLYEPFMAYKDEIAMITGVRPTVSFDKKLSVLTDSKGFDQEVKEQLKRMLSDKKLDGKKLSELISKGLKSE